MSILLELATLELASAQRIDLPVLTFAVALELEEPLLPSSQGDNGTVIGGLRV